MLTSLGLSTLRRRRTMYRCTIYIYIYMSTFWIFNTSMYHYPLCTFLTLSHLKKKYGLSTLLPYTVVCKFDRKSHARISNTSLLYIFILYIYCTINQFALAHSAALALSHLSLKQSVQRPPVKLQKA